MHACVRHKFFHPLWDQWSVRLWKHTQNYSSNVGGQALTLMWDLIILFVFALMFPFSSSVFSYSACLWAGSRISAVVMPLPYCIECVYLACMCVRVLYMGVQQKRWNYCKYVTLLRKCMREWLDEWNSDNNRVYSERLSLVICMKRAMKSRKECVV